MTTRIVPATPRDLCYIAANLRPQDRAELECQMDEWSVPAVAAITMQSTFAFICELNGNPELAFGSGQIRTGLWVAWSWGTKRQRHCLPTAIDFIRTTLQPEVYAAGALRVEARALASHRVAHRFLELIGGTKRCDLPAFGKGGEDFVLYDWTRESWNKHVLHPSNAKAAANPARAAD